MRGAWRRLAEAGVLGINRRNADFTLMYNRRDCIALVDDKLVTKALAQARGIAVPELYGAVEIEHDVRRLPRMLAGRNEFVVKPARGSGGDGILVVAGRFRDMYRRVSGALMDQSDLNHHVSNILSGMYSLGGFPDKALIEYRVEFDPVFEAISYQGVPDVRIIVFLGVPVMAMVRLPCRLSDGRANLHQGAIGTGVDMATGRTLTAVWRTEVVAEHPDTGNPVTGVAIPHWPRMLETAAGCFEMTGLGYQGVDLVLDRTRGPMMLEINARPGLNIQIANRAGLLNRLRQVQAVVPELHTVEQRVAFARERFAVRPSGILR
ncbi:MAG TPA: alpha-L-glutamate ligase-like protein [Gammaproteobacteria bacterium]|nr:alpha-L-glutamate ligase-like protein [Gammaproteobacteria bacterium]